VEDLAAPGIRIIAVANPDLAPYGKAAITLLKRQSDWDAVKPKLVYAENISIAKQYGKSNNADVVFTAYSLVLHEGGKVIRLGSSGLEQEVAIVASSHRQGEARTFLDFLVRGKGREILIKYGYGVGPNASSQ
jgi:molybdate transport system substrate-binding protein